MKKGQPKGNVVGVGCGRTESLLRKSERTGTGGRRRGRHNHRGLRYEPSQIRMRLTTETSRGTEPGREMRLEECEDDKTPVRYPKLE